MLRTLLLNPPSFQDFDGGAGSRYQATREVVSFNGRFNFLFSFLFLQDNNFSIDLVFIQKYLALFAFSPL